MHDSTNTAGADGQFGKSGSAKLKAQEWPWVDHSLRPKLSTPPVNPQTPSTPHSGVAAGDDAPRPRAHENTNKSCTRRVFFGRDAQIVRGLDEIRRLTRTGVSRMFVILGASGSGKSSFLRAGLWPRLTGDYSVPGSSTSS